MSEQVGGLEQGIQVQLDIAPSRQLGKFLKDMPAHVGDAFKPGDVHATIFYPEELAMAGLGHAERAKLPKAEHAIALAVNELDIVGKTLDTAPNILRPYKKFYGIEVLDEDDICTQIRTLGSEIIDRVLSIKLRSYLDSYHAAVARRRPSDGRKTPLKYHKHFPPKLTIGGFSVGLRSALTGSSQSQCYIRDIMRADPNRLYS